MKIAIIGGGLAGLSLSILLGRQGFEVCLFEAGDYPRHKVCGEYISNESKPFVEALGFPFEKYNVPAIKHFRLTHYLGYKAQTTLAKGGFGISRYALDSELYQIALQEGVSVFTQTRAQSVEKQGDKIILQTADNQIFEVDLVVGAYGRVSNFQHNTAQNAKAQPFIGVKYHIEADLPADYIEIHTFRGGYCGISQIETGKFCLCYLTQNKYLKDHKGDLNAFEQNILAENPFLKRHLAQPKVMEGVTTSQFYFGIKPQNEPHILPLGDAAGFIPPITGNGMSLAFRASAELYKLILDYNTHKSYETLQKAHQNYIQKYLNHRITQGVFLQNLLFRENRLFQTLMMKSFQYVPFALQMMTRKAVGKDIETPKAPK